MVCVPCFIIPVLLYLWHKFVQPILLRYWNPWSKRDADGKVIKATPEFPFECKGGKCSYLPAADKTNCDDGNARLKEDTSGQKPLADEDQSKKNS